MVESFWHNCIWSDCPTFVETDNHPWCDIHVPPSGPVVEGYSAKTAVELLAPYEIVTELLNELVTQKKRARQNRLPGFEDLSLDAKIEMGKVWLTANLRDERKPVLFCKAHLSGDGEAL